MAALAFVCLFIWMSPCACMFSYLGGYLTEGNTHSYLLPSKKDGPLYIYRDTLYCSLKLLSLLHTRLVRTFCACMRGNNSRYHEVVVVSLRIQTANIKLEPDRQIWAYVLTPIGSRLIFFNWSSLSFSLCFPYLIPSQSKGGLNNGVTYICS